MKRPKGTVDVLIGPLPVEKINRALRVELEAGQVILTRGSQIHAARNHPEDYARCMPHLAEIISNPAYIGDDVKNADSFELIGRAAILGEMILVAILFEPDGAGCYRIASFYPVSDKKIQGRRAKGFLKIAL